VAILNRSEIAARIPHGGSMVLLDSVLEWDAAKILCTAVSHIDAQNPLRVSRLNMMAGIEFAAQAMALHGALNSDQPGQQRVLGSVRKIRCAPGFLDDAGAELRIAVELVGRNATGALYNFSLRGDAELLSGSATVFASR
jgi:predicted hotdog family 3-hydroxylacyl-ACP dehydratase